jgi:5-formyltetrahydrofolate cyclo-ligase
VKIYTPLPGVRETFLKKNLREKLLRKRDSIEPKEKRKKDAAIRKRLYASTDFRNAKSILFYASFRSEAATIQCIVHALKLKKMVMLPLVDRKRKTLRIFQIKNVSDLKSGFMDIPEPDAQKMNERCLNDIDIAIIPGAGFDPEGNRLGYGAGYYDKLLSGIRDQGLGVSKKELIPKTQNLKPVLIALAFEEQVVPEIPSDKHDIKMDGIITEKRTIYCRKKRLTTENTEVTE